MTPDPAFQADYEARAITQAGGAMTLALQLIVAVRGKEALTAAFHIRLAIMELDKAATKRADKERAAA